MDDAYKTYKENNCNLINIRDTKELNLTGAIENSINIQEAFGVPIDPNGPLTQSGIIDPSKEIVLFCAAGGRSALATKALQKWVIKKFVV